MKPKPHQNLIDKIFSAQDEDGLWKVLPKTDPHYPGYLHYVPNFKASLWTLILLADLEINRNEKRVKKTLEEVNSRSLKALEFFHKFQRFDDGTYEVPKNKFCSNTSCYGKHSCYWGIVKLLKGISFIPSKFRTQETIELRDRCVGFILKHQVCFSSHHPDKIRIDKIDRLTFPNMYKSDFLEILWVLKREGIKSSQLNPAIQLLKSKRQENGSWLLERKISNMVVSIGEINMPNPYIQKRAEEVLNDYTKDILSP